MLNDMTNDNLHESLAELGATWAAAGNNETLRHCGETLLELMAEDEASMRAAVAEAAAACADRYVRGRNLIEQGFEVMYGPGWDKRISLDLYVPNPDDAEKK